MVSTLIRSTLVSSPLYMMSIFRIPKVVSKRLEKIQRNFLWGGGSQEGRTHTVNWDTICLNKNKGGLGVRRLLNLNRALLGKWIWRFIAEKEAPWRLFITLKYETEVGWFTKGIRGHGVSIWKEIHKEAIKLNNSLVVGKGDRVMFWEDSSCSEIPLCDLFPRFYSMAGLRETKVMEAWENSEQGGGWNFNFEMPFNDWEMDIVESLIRRVRGRKINPVEEDKMVWKATKDGSYTVRSNLDVLEGGRGAEPFPKRMVWNRLVPTKVGFFV